MPKYSLEKNNTNSVFVSGVVLFTNGGSGGIRPTSLSAVSVVKRNATSFRLPETVANDGKGQRSIRKRLDCLCQTFSCATPCRAVFGGSGGIRTPVGLHPNGFQVFEGVWYPLFRNALKWYVFSEKRTLNRLFT